MNDTLTPPPAAPAPGATPSAPDQTAAGGRRPGKAVAIIATVAGGLVLLGTVTHAAVGTVRDAMRVSGSWTADARGVTSLDVEAAGSRFALEFGDVDEAVLEVDNARDGDWRIERDGSELVVRKADQLFGDWGFGREGETVVLTLPERLRGAALDADLHLAAGELRADAVFGELTLDLGSGAMDVTGTARSLDAEVSAGQIELDLADVAAAELTASAGRIVGDLTGDAPDTVAIDVSAGSVELGMPRATYDVRSDVAAGSFDNRLDTSSSAPRQVTVDVSAGRVQLTPAD
ncbi:hypothetical protein [Microbacterium sp. NPDC096154]|uniref:hypothetical protein n=1 Tax=Microbacterium sp. NPDC096154 TaxID=3155549 RepID=UPI0033312E90